MISKLAEKIMLKACRQFLVTATWFMHKLEKDPKFAEFDEDERRENLKWHRTVAELHKDLDRIEEGLK